MTIRWLPRMRRPLSILLAVIVGLVLTACSGSKHHDPQSITLVASATAAEPAAGLNAAAKQQLTNIAEASDTVGGATIRIVTSRDAPAVTIDLTPVRSNAQIEHSQAARDKKIAAAVDEVDHRLNRMASDRAGLDLLSLLDTASQLPGNELVVVSSGLSTENPIDYRQLGFDLDPAKIVQSVKQQGMLPNLAGHRVMFIGLGESAGTQPAEPPYVRDLVSRVWLGVCQQAGAVSCASAGRDQATPPIATLPVPMIPIPASHSEQGCPVWQRLSDDQLHFLGDSAELPSSADSILIPIVQAAQRCSLLIDLAGYVADTGNGDLENLSLKRARAVADRLTQLGLPANQVGTVVGRGTADPVISNFTAGQFDEAKAALNRRVELTFRRSS